MVNDTDDLTVKFIGKINTRYLYVKNKSIAIGLKKKIEFFKISTP